mmetsp:Transcript_28260/g.81071  ORF Transcript_28260/g.81071 Transcript_28260/m.81071 type:complete len:297 (-) Transcript_28260:64-954(-)
MRGVESAHGHAAQRRVEPRPNVLAALIFPQGDMLHADDGILIASEYASLLLELTQQERNLRPRRHDGEAEQRRRLHLHLRLARLRGGPRRGGRASGVPMAEAAVWGGAGRRAGGSSAGAGAAAAGRDGHGSGGASRSDGGLSQLSSAILDIEIDILVPHNVAVVLNAFSRRLQYADSWLEDVARVLAGGGKLHGLALLVLLAMLHASSGSLELVQGNVEARDEAALDVFPRARVAAAKEEHLLASACGGRGAQSSGGPPRRAQGRQAQGQQADGAQAQEEPPPPPPRAGARGTPRG